MAVKKKVTAKATSKKEEAPKEEVIKEEETTLGEVVMVHTKSSSHWTALLQPKFVTIAEMRFVEGTQVTGKEGHRMERKRTLIPADHIASIVEFKSEDELFSQPQPKHVPVVEDQQSAILTSHEQGGPPERPQRHPAGGGGRHHRHHGRHRPRHGGNSNNSQQDARFQQQYASRQERDFNR